MPLFVFQQTNKKAWRLISQGTAQTKRKNNTMSLETICISIFIYLYIYIDVYIQVFVFRQKHVNTTDIQ